MSGMLFKSAGQYGEAISRWRKARSAGSGAGGGERWIMPDSQTRCCARVVARHRRRRFSFKIWTRCVWTDGLSEFGAGPDGSQSPVAHGPELDVTMAAEFDTDVLEFDVVDRLEFEVVDTAKFEVPGGI